MEMRSQRVNILAMEDKVTEENIMVTYASGATGEQEMYPYGGSAGQNSYQVRNGEAIELISLGYDGAEDANLQKCVVRDRDNTLWNEFFVYPYYQSANRADVPTQLPHHDPWDFERTMMSWGYESFAHRVGTAKLTPGTTKGIAPTLKLGDGDYLRIKNSSATTSVAIYASAVIRRYKNGSGVPFDIFGDFDGGVKSNKQFYNDPQSLTTSTANTWTDAWTLTLNKSEVYQFFQGGLTSTRYLTQSRIRIDDKHDYNTYYAMPFMNQLPFNRGGSVASRGTRASYSNESSYANVKLLKGHRFTPTIKVVKNTNKNLKVQTYATTGSSAIRVYMAGIKHIAKSI